MRVCIFGVAALLMSSAPVFGHGVQIQVTYNPVTQRIETRKVVHTDTRPDAISDVTHVYVMPLMPLSGGAGDGWYTRPEGELNAFGIPVHPTGPGVAYQFDPSQLPGTGWAFSGSSTLPNLQNTSFGYQFVDGLKSWNGVSFVDPGLEQLQAFRGDGTTPPTVVANSSDVGPFATLALSNIGTQSSNAHHSVGFRLLGDGVSSGLSGTVAGDDGVYLASFLLSSTAAGVGNSEPFYFVLYKNTAFNVALEAANSLGYLESQVQIVPEPATLAMLGLATFLRRPRRRNG